MKLGGCSVKRVCIDGLACFDTPRWSPQRSANSGSSKESNSSTGTAQGSKIQIWPGRVWWLRRFKFSFRPIWLLFSLEPTCIKGHHQFRVEISWKDEKREEWRKEERERERRAEERRGEKERGEQFTNKGESWPSAFQNHLPYKSKNLEKRSTNTRFDVARSAP